MACTHPAAAITDQAIHGYDKQAIRYAWRGACLSCRHGVVGMTSVPSELSGDRLNAVLTNDLMAYLNQAAARSMTIQA